MRGATVCRFAIGAAIASLLMFSLSYVTTFRTRISVLPSLQVDASTYDTIALELANTWSLDAIPPLQPPGFVAFLATIFTAFGHSWIAGRVALWVCLVLATVSSAFLARAMYRSELAGWFAALLCAASPALRAYAGTLQYELLAAVLLLFIVWASWRITEGRSGDFKRRVIVVASLGAGMGLSILTREVFVAIVPVVGLYLYARLAPAEGPLRAALLTFVCIACASSLPIGWSALQSARMGRVVTVSEKGPLVMAFGNNPAANGTFNAPLTGVPEPSGWRFITANPRTFAWLAGRKAMYFWGLLRDGWNVPRSSGVAIANASGGALPLQWILPWVRGGSLLVLFLTALLLWRRHVWAAWWFVPATVLAIMTVHVITVSSYRFAIPVLPLVIAIVAGPIARMMAAVSHRRRARTVAIGALLFVVLMQLRAWPLVYELSAAEFDGVAAANRTDERTGETVRFADAAPGRRAALLLVDEYLPAGAFSIELFVRTERMELEPGTSVLRVTVATLDGVTACERTVSARELGPPDTPVTVPCSLSVGGPSTFVVETLGVAPLTFGRVRFLWASAPRASTLAATP